MDGNILYVLSLPLSCAALIGLVFWAYQAYRLDKYRECLFSLRDELFDFARAGNIPFNHPAYVMLRHTLNGAIRFAHKLGVLEFMIYCLLGGGIGGTADRSLSYSKQWESATNGLDADTKAALERLRFRYHARIFGQLFFTSPIFVVTLVTFVAYIFWRIFSSKIMKALESVARGAFVGQITDRYDLAALSLGG